MERGEGVRKHVEYILKEWVSLPGVRILWGCYWIIIIMAITLITASDNYEDVEGHNDILCVSGFCEILADDMME